MAERPPGRDPVAPSRTDPLARAWTERIGGPVGEHSRPHSYWTPVRVILAVAAVVCGLALVQKSPCIETGWTNNTARYAKMCYSDLPYLYTGRGFAEQTWPYSDTGGRYPAMEYPVGIAYFAWATAEMTHVISAGPPEVQRAEATPDQLFGLPGMDVEINQFFLINTIALLGVAMLATYWLAGAHRRRPWDAMAFAASPALLFTGLINWDLLAVACVAGAFWAWARGRPVLTGVFLGLGAATKLYPLFLFGALLVVCVRRRQWSVLGRAVVAGLVTWVLVNLPALLTGPARWKVFWTFNSDRGPDLGSLWLFAANRGYSASPEVINVVSAVGFVAVCVGVLVLGLKSERTPRVAQLGFLIVAGFLILNKVYSPQYVLWLLPLAVLARPRWRDLIVWQACELFYFGAVWLHLGGYSASGTTGGADPLYQAAILVRVLGELYLVALVVRDIWWARHDPVRGPGELVEHDPVEGRRREADPDVDLLADLRRRDAAR